MTPPPITRTRTPALLVLIALMLAVVACGSGNRDLMLDAPQFPRRSDLGDLAPAEGRNQRMFNDATLALATHDGERYTLDGELLWVVLHSSDESEDRALGHLEFQHRSGRDDAAMIPLLSELAASVNYQFDERAATDFVTSNDDGFSMEVKPVTTDDYGIFLEVNDRLNNAVILKIYFPIEGFPLGEPSDDYEPHPFNGRPIDS